MATPAVIEIVADRVYPHRQPPALRLYPMVVYRCSDDEYGDTFAGRTDLLQENVDIACIATSYPQARALHDAVSLQLDNTSGMWGPIIVQGSFKDGGSEDITMPPDTDRQYFIVESSYLVWYSRS